MTGKRLRYLTRERRQAAVMITAAFAVHLCSLALPVMTLQVYDRIIKFRGEGTLTVLICGVVVAIGLEWAARTARSAYEAWRSASMEHQLQTALLSSALSSLPGRGETRTAAARLHDLSALGTLKERYGGETVAIWVELPFVAIFLGIIAYLAGWLVLVPMALLVLFSAAVMWLGARLKRTLERREEAEEARDAMMLEALETIHLVKAMTLERGFQRRYEAVQTGVSEAGFKTACWGGAIASLGAWCAQMMTIAVMAAGAPLVVSGRLSTGVLVATILLSGRLMQPVQQALGLWLRQHEFELAEARLREVFGQPKRPLQPDAPQAVAEGRLMVENLHFAYQGESEDLLRNVSLTVEPGEAVHISALPGSGATTFLKLLAGIYMPNQGTVRVDGQDMAQLGGDEALRHVAYLPTHGVVYRGSVMENLTGFAPERQEQALELSHLLGIAGPILRLPQGYDTLLEGGVADLVPPGLAQRITIARALIRKPKLILFDQADRALDKDGYNHVFTLLGKLKGRASLIIVSGDYNLIRFADRRLRLDQGLLTIERRLSNARPLVPLKELAG